jgi:hypothetical protein
MGDRRLRPTLRRPLLSAEMRARAATQKWQVARVLSTESHVSQKEARSFDKLRAGSRRADARLGMTTVWVSCLYGAAEAVPFFKANILQVIKTFESWFRAEAFVPRATVHFNYGPQSRGMFEIYRETWCLLTCSVKARARGGVPTRCRCKEMAQRCVVWSEEVRGCWLLTKTF